MKKVIPLIMLLVMLCTMPGGMTLAGAEIIPPHGEGQIGLQAVVLCEELSLRREPSASSSKVETLSYGALPIVMRQENGWAYCTTGDSEDSTKGWLNADYIVIDPAWYRTDAGTPVYAWNDDHAPKVALLDKNVILPILKEEEDWLIVSLRGAAGWIRKSATD